MHAKNIPVSRAFLFGLQPKGIKVKYPYSNGIFLRCHKLQLVQQVFHKRKLGKTAKAEITIRPKIACAT